MTDHAKPADTLVLPRFAAAMMLLLSLLVTAGCKTQGQNSDAPVAGFEHVEEAQAYLEQGLDDSALAAFGLAIEENPQITEAHMGMGEIYRKRKQYDMAVRSYETATRVDPNSFLAHYGLGLSNQLWGRIEEAIKAYLRALVIDPNSFKANQNLASAYLQLGQPTNALPYAQRASQLDRTSQAAWANLGACHALLHQYEAAAEAYRQALELGELDTRIMLGLVDAHIRLGNYRRAINVLDQIIRREPSSTALERTGYCHYKLKNFDTALEFFNRALELDEKDTAALNGKGAASMTLYYHTGRKNRDYYSQAMSCWRQSLRIKPRQPRIIDLISRYQAN